MKKYSFLVILALLFTACGESVEEQAQRYIDRANQAFQTENYSEAKQLIDSVKILFPKAFEARKQGKTYTFYDGPPTANGKPHIGHVLTRVIKDMIPRYRTMKGCHVIRKAGWDTHGLPVELGVEKKLNITKEDIYKPLW